MADPQQGYDNVKAAHLKRSIGTLVAVCGIGDKSFQCPNPDTPQVKPPDQIGAETRAALPIQGEYEGGSECRFLLSKLVPLINATKNYSVLDELEVSLGRIAIVVSKSESSLNDISNLAMQSLKEFGNLKDVIGKGMADQGVSPDQKRQIKKVGYEALEAITALLMAIKQQRGEK